MRLSPHVALLDDATAARLAPTVERIAAELAPALEEHGPDGWTPEAVALGVVVRRLADHVDWEIAAGVLDLVMPRSPPDDAPQKS